MITTGFDARVKVQQIVDNQLPEFLVSEAPKAAEFLKQYYISQEYQGGPIDIAENLDQYLNLNNLTPEVVVGITSLTSDVTAADTTISVQSTKGYPNQYGLFKIGDEIVTYTGITTNTFTGCVRGFSGITTYRDLLNPEELVFSASESAAHANNSPLENLSALFLKEFYKKVKYLLAPGFEDISFVDNLDVNKFIKQIRNFYQAKGTDEAFRILWNVLYGYDPKVINLEDYLLKPSAAEYIRREVLVCERISGDPNLLVGEEVKSSDNTASGPVSEVEILQRAGKTFYKIQLFSGFNDKSLIEGTFKISAKSTVADNVGIGASVITVDSTIGFPPSGIVHELSLVAGINTSITYTDKSINQFFGCKGIVGPIEPSSAIRSNESIYGYENGDPTKKVVLRVTGVLSDIDEKENISLLLKDQKIGVKNLGEKIENNNEEFKEFAFNTWLYNTSSRYEIETFTPGNNQIGLFEETDKSSLKVGDHVDIVDRNAQNVIVLDAIVTTITGLTIDLTKNIPSNILSNREISIRKRFNYSTSSSNVGLNVPNILSNTLNTYNEKDQYMYAASNSLPDYTITKNRSSADINIVPGSVLGDIFKGYDIKTNRYSILSFNVPNNKLPFVTGDAVVYSGTVGEISGLVFGQVYYVQIIRSGSNTNQLRLYNSRSFIGSLDYVQFSQYAINSTHTFTLESQYNKSLSAKKALFKFPLDPNIKSGTNQKTVTGSIGSLINGVEIINYKSSDKIYYGPLESVRIYNSGKNYDVINPPSIIVSKPAVGVGTTAVVRAVISGNVKEVQIDPQDFSFSRVLSATLTGGNGEGAVLEPVLSSQYKNLEFNAAMSDTPGGTGGVDVDEETITFTRVHNISDGTKLVYNPSGNNEVGVGSYGKSNTDQGDYLINGAVYYPRIINTSTVQLYKTEADFLAGINTVGFTTIAKGGNGFDSKVGGIHKFRVFEIQNIISEIKVISPGSGYANRRLSVLPTGISTTADSITYENHGFNDGDIVNYSTDGTHIKGISDQDDYYILKIDADEFQLADSGITQDNVGSNNFDGSDEYLDIEASPDFAFGTGDFTFECWIKTDNKTQDGGINRRIFKLDGPTAASALGNIAIYVISGTGAIRAKSTDNVDSSTVTGTTDISDNVWHNITLTRSSGILRLFVDGVLEGSATNNIILSANSGSPRPRIGSDSGSAGDFDGNVSNLRIVRGKSLYNTDFTPSKSPLKKVDNTILLCCKNSKSETAEETDKVVIDSGSVGKSSDHPFTLGDGTAKYYYNRRKAIQINGIGAGLQKFAYPPIKVNIDAEFVGAAGIITATPIVRGEIVDTYLDEKGTDYGSNVLNFHKYPKLTIKNGSGAQFNPIISNGKIVSVQVQDGGTYYNAPPDLKISGEGSGAKLRAITKSGIIRDVVVLNQGTGYKQKNTYISATSAGQNGVVQAAVRGLVVNNEKRFSDEIYVENGETNLSYGVVGYSTDREGSSFSDPNPDTGHSKVIGWAYDGNPIYGPFGYSDPKDDNSPIKRIETSYTASIGNVNNRPPTSEFELGFFVEDYKFDGSGDLDVHNGRFTKTPEFPHGVYSYHVGVTTDTTLNRLVPEFPYFVGDTFRSNPISNVINQSFNFNNSSLIRNTFPYRVNQPKSGNDFIVESNEEYKQISVVEDASIGSIDSLKIINSGSKYRVGNAAVFDNSGTAGGAAAAEVIEIMGKDIENVETTYDEFNPAVIVWESQNQIRVNTPSHHNLVNGDKMEIAGLSTFVKGLAGTHIIGVASETSSLLSNIPINSGVTTDIYISNIPSNVGSGSSIGIGTETFAILSILEPGVLRVRREHQDRNVSHSISTAVSFYPDSFTVLTESEYFDSTKNYSVNFNPKESVGIGTTSGFETTSSFYVGISPKTVSIPTQSIYLPNHPFKNNEKILFTKPNSANAIEVGLTSTSNVFNIPITGDQQELFVINKSKDFIGLSTIAGVGTDITGHDAGGLYFTNFGSNDYRYNFKTQYDQVTGDVRKIKTRIGVSTFHKLSNGDEITLISNPNLSVGVANSESVKIRYDSINKKILVNPIGFSSQSILTDAHPIPRYQSSIGIATHGFKSGDKVFYEADLQASGLSTGSYFVYRIDANNIKLSETYNDVFTEPPITVGIGSTGGNDQKLSLLNPQLTVTRNNNLVFDVSDDSLIDYDFKFYYDTDLSNEFVSTGTTSLFSVIQTQSTSGISTLYTINYNDNLPTKLYYSFAKNGVAVDPDSDVKDGSEILYTDSFYNGKYKVFGIGATDFYISLKDVPERLSYSAADCSTLKYNTTSKTADGSISKFNIISQGDNYDKLPRIIGLTTGTSDSLGINAVVSSQSDNIGKLNRFRIVNEGFEYSADKTLRPQADIPTHIILDNSYKITGITVEKGGKNYLSAPDLVLVNTYTGKKVDSGILEAVFNPATQNNSITSVNIIEQPQGLQSVDHKVYALRNSNGVQVNKILSYSYGIVECQLTTPPLTGFVTPPFKPGDKVFVEGLVKGSDKDPITGITSSPGNGFNSTDNRYNFFEVVEYTNSNPATLKYDVAPFTSNAGNHRKDYNAGDIIDQTLQYNAIVKQSNYPTFIVTNDPSAFYLGEPLMVNNVMSDLVVTTIDKDFIKVTGEDSIKKTDILKGTNSGNTATIREITKFGNRFQIDYSNKREYGWKDSTGKLNDDLQVIPDNDYYQNLSYTIKSPVEYKTLKDSVNKLVHPVGMKNFADTELISKAEVGVAVTGFFAPVLDFVAERRVDTISNFDMAVDYNPTVDSSRYILFKNKKLTDYITCNTNRVLQIDDISNAFSSSEFNKRTYTDGSSYPITDFYSKYFVQITDVNKLSSQVSEIVILNNLQNTYTLNKSSIWTDKRLGTFSGTMGEAGDPVLRFSPDDPNNFSYDLKIYRESFADTPYNIGLGVTEIGFTRLSAKTERVGPASGTGLIGFSTAVFQANVNDFNAFYAQAHILDEGTYRGNYFEVAGYYDGTNTHIAEYYFDTSNYGGVSSGAIGTFTSSVSSGLLELVFNNETQGNVLVKTKAVGIGSTQFNGGIGTHRFLVDQQIGGTEKSTRFESKVTDVVGVTTIINFDQSIDFSVRSIVKVSVGSSVDIHNITVSADQLNTTIQQAQFLSTGALGIGTFTTDNSGYSVSVKFHPDAAYASDNIVVQSFTQFVHSEVDKYNIPDSWEYGTSIENLSNAFYGSINDFGKDKLNFDLNYNSIPIFQKTFNPADTTKLNRVTGLFTINDHFFETGEELIYTPDSTLIGVGATALGIGATITDGALFTGDLITGFSTITGIAASTGIISGTMIYGSSIDVASNTTISGIDTSYTWFTGDVGTASSVITGIANTSLLTVGAGIYSGGDKTDLGKIYSIGINSITASNNIIVGTGRSYYTTDTNWAVTLSNPGTATTFRQSYTSGISTDICPSTVYAIKISKDTFKITGTSGGTNNNPGIGFTFTDVGGANYHKLEMKKKLEKALITVDGVTQYPLIYTPLTFKFKDNPSTIGAGVTFLSLSGISSIKPRDLLKVNDEFMRIDNVGLGTTSSGPISGIGSANVIEVTRGFVGTAKTDHADGSDIRIYKGAFNIVGNEIWFTDAPDGRGSNNTLNSSALPSAKSTFNGRVYLRQDYTSNKIYDDISLQFNGIGQTFTVYKEGKNVTGMEAGSDVLFINDVFQTPDTENNTGKNYKFTDPDEADLLGISSVTFTGVSKPNEVDTFTVDYDVNQNQLPRGGVVISIGSSGGLGYAPLVGAAFTIGMVNNSITSIGIGTTGTWGAGYKNPVAIGVTDLAYRHKFVSCGVNSITVNTGVGSGTQYTATGALYESHSGICTITVPNHSIRSVYDSYAAFKSNVGTGITNTSFEMVDFGNFSNTSGWDIGTGWTISSGTAKHDGSASGFLTRTPTIPFIQDQWYLLTAEISRHGLNGNSLGMAAHNEVGVKQGNGSTLADAYCEVVGNKVIALWQQGKDNLNKVNFFCSGGNANITIDNLSIKLVSPLLNTIGIATGGLVFSCDRDDFNTNHAYPRTTDPAHNSNLIISSTTDDTITVGVGSGGGSGTGAVVVATVGARYPHKFVSATAGAAYTGGDHAHTWVSPATNSIVVDNWGGTNLSPTGVGYTPSTGDIVLTFGANHNLTAGSNTIGIRTESLIFTCDRDHHNSQKKYPRTTDPVHNQQLAVIWNTPRKLMVHVGVTSNNPYNISDAEYNPATGDLILTSESHDLTTDSIVGIETGSLSFTCAQDSYATTHAYPRSTDPYYGGALGVSSTTDNTFTVNVGSAQSGAGGALTFNIKQGGKYYINPRITVDDPTYENLNVSGLSRLGIGQTSKTGIGLSMTLDLTPPVDAGKRLRGPIPTPVSNKHADASDLIISNKTLIAEVAVGRMLEKYSGNYDHRFVSANSGAVNKVSPSGSAITPNHAFFTPSTGVLKLTFASAHGLSNTNTIKLDNLSLKFTCGLDNHTSFHSYPRTTDPISGITTAISNVGGGGTDFTINVGQVLQSSIIPQYKTNSSVTNQDCIDDVIDVLEVVAHNTQFDGNDQTVDAANLYITGAHVAGEEQETIYAFQEARNMAIQAIRNEEIGIGSGGQYTHAFVKSDADALRIGGAYGHTFVSAAANAVSITGAGSTTPSGAAYDGNTGVLTLTFANAHGINNSNTVTIANHSLTFTCEGDNNATQHSYPRATDPAYGKALNVTSHTSSAPHQITVQVGMSTFVNVAISTATYNPASGDFVATVGAGHTILGPLTLNTPTAVTYAPTTGSLRLTIAGHGCAVGDRIKIADESLTFTCAYDQHATQHSYPRSSDPFSGEWLTITQRTSNRIWVNVGVAGISSAHTFVSAKASSVEKSRTNLGITTESMTWRCDRDHYASDAVYPRTTDPYHNRTVSVASTTDTTVTFNVGVSSSNYTLNSQYYDRNITGDQSGTRGSYITGDCAKVASAVSTLVGIVTNAVNSNALPTKTASNPALFEVSKFEVTKPGYAFMRGDFFEPVGLVTAAKIVGDRYAHKFIRSTADSVFTGGDYAHTFVTARTGAAFTGGNYSHTFVPRPENTNCVSVGSWTGTKLTPTVAAYDAKTGNLILTFAANHNLTAGSNTIGITTTSLAFTCSRDNHASVHEYPRNGDPIHGLANVAIAATTLTTLTVNVGVSTIVNNPVSIGTYTPSTGELILDVGTNHGFTTAFTRSITTCTYNPTNGVIDFTSNAHGMSSGDYVRFPANSLVFTCAKDVHATEHAYPRNLQNKDRLGKQWLPIDYVGINTFQVNVGAANDSTVGVHTFVRADGQFRWANKSAVVGIATESLIFTCAKDSDSSQHAYPRTTDPVHGRQLGIGATGHTSITVNVGISTLVKYDTADANYNPQTGDLIIVTDKPHGLKVGNKIGISTGSLTFTCAKDGYVSEHGYPRTGFAHTFVSADNDAVEVTGAASTTPTGAEYFPSTGDLVLSFANAHGLSLANTVGIATNSLTFTCAKDVHASEHKYPRKTDPISGVTTAIKSLTSTTIRINVGRSNTGDPYDNRQIGVTTTGKYTFIVNVGVAAGPKPRTPLTFDVKDTFSDSFASWQLGQFDYIDPIKSLQNGIRTRFPLYKNSQLLSFQKDPSNANSSLIDFDTILLIYINGVMQEPKVSYNFTGGTTFTFTQAPLPDDDIDIFFYRGTSGFDSVEVNVNETIKPGDDLQIRKNTYIPSTVGQDKRVLARILSSDQVETGVYLGDGIDAINYKPIDWTKQKRDIIISDNPVYKQRDSIEGMVFPSTHIISDLKTSEEFIFVDDAHFFNYEENESTIDINEFSGLIVDGVSVVSAGFTAVVSAAGTISSVGILTGGSGYTPSSTISLDLSGPIGGIGTVFKTAVAGVGTLGIGSAMIMGIGSTAGIEIGYGVKAIPNILGSDVTVTGISTSHYLGAGATQYSVANMVSISTNASNTTVIVTNFEFGKYQEQSQATATATVSAAGTISATTVTNPGSGYTASSSTPFYNNGRYPSVLSPIPTATKELISGIRFTEGYSGIITGITTSVGTTGNQSMALTFHVKHDANIGVSNLDRLVAGYPIYVSNTLVGHGVTSVDSGDTALVGIGTTFADNIYKIHAITRSSLTGIITCNVHTGINTAGIPDNTNDISGISTIFGGKFSWGKLSGFDRVTTTAVGFAVSGYTVNSGLTTFPTIQRRGYGLRDSGSLRKDLG